MIETKRLLIRNYEKQDLDDVSKFLLDKRQMTYIPESFESQDDVSMFMEKQSNKFYSVILKENNKVIGHISFYPFFGNHSYEIGWVFNKNYTNKGYAFEAAFALMNEGFTNGNIHRVIATAQPQNIGSWKLMEKLQMRREAHFKECIPHDDGWWDEYYYAILKEEWLQTHENIL